MRLVSFAPTIFMLACFAWGPAVLAKMAISPTADSSAFPKSLAASYLNGQAAAAFEAGYEDQFPLRAFAIGAANFLSVAVLHEARDGVVMGRDGWLFSEEEFSWNARSEGLVQRNIDRVKQVSGNLAAKNISLTIALVPQKAQVERAHLEVAVPQVRRELHAHVLNELQRLPSLNVVDLQTAMQAEGSEAPMFLRADTHWNALGAQLSAEAIAASLGGRTDLMRTRFAVSADLPVEHRGDLYRFMELGPFGPLLPQPTETIVPIRVTKADASLTDFFDIDTNPQPEIALVGTSYSANPLWSFPSRLRAALSAEIINYASAGEGPFAPMEDFLSMKLNATPNIEHVIWEVPVRYFDKPDDTSQG